MTGVISFTRSDVDELSGLIDCLDAVILLANLSQCHEVTALIEMLKLTRKEFVAFYDRLDMRSREATKANADKGNIEPRPFGVQASG